MICRPQIIVRQLTSGTLIRIRGEKKPVDEDDRSACERRTNLARDELGTRRHEQQRFRGGLEIRRRIEEDATNLVADRGAARFTHRDDLARVCAKPVGQQAKLRALPRTVRAFENDEAATRHARCSSRA